MADERVGEGGAQQASFISPWLKIGHLGSYRSDGYNDDYKDQRSQSHPYSGPSSCGSGMTALRKAPLAPTLHPHPQSQSQQQHHHQPHLPLSSLLDDSEDDVTSSVNNAISAITAAAANCMSSDMNSGGNRGDDRRDIIGGLLGGLGLGPLGVSQSGPSSTSGIDKSYRGGVNSGGMGGLGPNQQIPGAKPKRPRKPRKKKEPGPGGEIIKRRQTSHRGINGNERPYLCSVCGRGFARRETLRRHDRIHTGEKPHHCTVCGKYFREAFHLSKHHTVHSGEKNYKCGLCGKDFGYAQSLKRHAKLHQKGELEEVPTTPGGENLNSYTNSGAMNQDRGQGNSSYYSYSQDVKPQGSHSQPPPRLYTCAICWKSFRHHFHLTAHHQTVHETGGEKLFSCEVCGKAFAYSNSLTRHRLSQHGLSRTGQTNSQGDTSGSGANNSVGGSVSESEAATNALLQLAPPGGAHGEQQAHGGVLHSHQPPPPQPQAGYSPLFYVPDTNTSHPSSSNASPYSHPLPSSSNIPPLSHQQSPTGVKGEPLYQTGAGHTMNTNPSGHPSFGMSPNEPHPLHHLHHHHHHSEDLQSHQHHQSFHSQDDLRKKKKKKKKKDDRLRGVYRWDERVGGEQIGREKVLRRKMLRRKRRAIHRRQRRFRKRMALLLRIRRGGSGRTTVCELAAVRGLKLQSLASLQNPLKRFPCPLCPRSTFSRRAALIVHRAAKHCPRASFPAERLKCNVCGKQSRKFLSFFIHRGSHLSKGTFSCKRCSSRFWNPSLLKRHKTSCRGKLAGLRRGRALHSKLAAGAVGKGGDGHSGQPYM
ncbi:zinc finger protein 850 isoform X3 [Clupea harengus]|uniref:Zinc finger protein 850 isoform X3 n=1 Tax=Clupea harengus TaxID=7950 RepID=A0A8M1KRP3_CLUHA|nr:zinc finger protein 850 isoform X3 [Clupea harengus]